MSIRVSEEELDKLKRAAKIEAYVSYSEFVCRTALIEVEKVITDKERNNNHVKKEGSFRRVKTARIDKR